MTTGIKSALDNVGFMAHSGAYVVVDGQFGSTGKGVLSALLAENFADQADLVMSNAGPNSGHTSYYEGEKIVLKQLPTFAVTARKMGLRIPTYLDAGAVIDQDTLEYEISDHSMEGWVHVHAHAARIRPEHSVADKDTTDRIGSTGKGMGPAIADKVRRHPDAVMNAAPPGAGYGLYKYLPFNPTRSRIMMEVSQGYSLGVNSGFYPYCTARECTVAQAMSDAGLHPHHFTMSLMALRTFPIRVAGNSGPCYLDQIETSWDELGQTPELTTVTQKVRRVFSFSKLQFMEAVAANRPDVLFVNFMNYVKDDHDAWVRRNIIHPYLMVMGILPEVVLLGYGPLTEDVKLWQP
jgi:adenylosuccinate synthase